MPVRTFEPGGILEVLRDWLRMNNGGFWRESVCEHGLGAFVNLLNPGMTESVALVLVGPVFQALQSWAYRLAEYVFTKMHRGSHRAVRTVYTSFLPRQDKLSQFCRQFAHERKPALDRVSEHMRLVLSMNRRGKATSRTNYNDPVAMEALLDSRDFAYSVQQSRNNQGHHDQARVPIDLTFCDIFIIIDLILFKGEIQ